MRAAFIRKIGEPEEIVVGELPRPEPGPGQVLVRVAASAVNPVDLYVRAGLIPWPLPMPFVPGCDLAGTVVEAGPDAARFEPGARVWGSNQGLLGRQGTSAEYAAVDERWLYAAPEGVADEDLAAVALVGITAHLGLFREAGLEPGETVFVAGGSGGVGSAVVQMAKLAGARVITSAGTGEKARLCRELGADEVILYREQKLDLALRELAPNGVSVWFETRRDPDFVTAVPLLAPRGRFILIAGRDARPPLPVGSFYTRDCRLLGFAMFNATPEEQRQAGEEIGRWLGAGKLRAHIDRVLPLAGLAEAHRLQEEHTVLGRGTLSGKLVIRI
jgi:NADPH:quinone reductase